jgi:hypothetical protein
LWSQTPGFVVEERRSTGTYFDLNLPEGYFVCIDPDVLYLYRPDGTLVARFSATGVNPPEITRAAWEDVQKGKEV